MRMRDARDMKEVMSMTTGIDRRTGPAMVWIDHEQAIIATQDAEGATIVEHLERGSGEPETAFDARAVDEVVGRAPVNVAGPAFARTAFERVYTSMTHRPDRLVDVEPGMDAADVADTPARR
jgi:hypothetical protein